MEKLTHINENGEAIMVDVSGKAVTAREAKAEGTIYVGAEILRLLQDDALPKGDVLAAARITKASVDFEVLGDRASVKAVCTVKTEGKTGVEMEALAGVSAALLTIYDMCKAVSKEMVIGDVHLVRKSGGKSGDFFFGREGTRL